MAGLATAYRLREEGVGGKVVVYGARGGGGIGSETRDGYMVELGAQLITSTYRHTLALVKELGLESDLKRTSPWMAIVKDGRPIRLPGGGMFPIYAITRGLVSIPDLA